MDAIRPATTRRTNTPSSRAHRRTLAVVLALLAVAGGSGAVQLMTGTFTPPVDDLEPLGLTSWLLPGLWLMASVAVPSTVAALAAWSGRDRAPELSLLAAALFILEEARRRWDDLSPRA